MKQPDELLILPQPEGFRAWRARGGQMQAVESEPRQWRGVGWVALPARSIVSVPMRFQGVEGERRESAAHLELEAAGFSSETADTHNFQFQTCGARDGRDQPLVATIQMAPLPEEVLESAKDARFAPAAFFRRFTAGEIQIWQEAGTLVIGIPHEDGSLLHSQALAARTLDADAATEVRRIIASLELAGITPALDSVCFISSSVEHDEVPQDFRDGLDLPVTVRRDLPPAPPAQNSRLVPAPVVQWRQERQQRRMVMTGVAVFAFVLVAVLGAFAARLVLRERQLAAEEQALIDLEPQLASIRDAKANWEDLRPALTPEQYPVESIYQLILLLPPEGIRVTRCELRSDGMVIDGEASSLGHGIEFRDKLVAAPAFQRWLWDFPQPTSLPDGRATFRAEARPVESADPNNPEVAVQ